MRRSPLADALFPRTRQRLLSALLLEPSRSRYAADLAKQLGVQRSTLQRDLMRLATAGILRMIRSGNRAYFQPNEDCPIFPELRSLFLKTTSLAEVLREELSSLAPQIKVAAVYGSIAAGKENPGSDIDLLVIGSVGLIDLVPMLESATQNLQRQINPTIHTPEDFSQKARQSRFLQSVLGKPLLFVIGTMRDLETITGGKAHHAGADGPGGD